MSDNFDKEGFKGALAVIAIIVVVAIAAYFLREKLNINIGNLIPNPLMSLGEAIKDAFHGFTLKLP